MDSCINRDEKCDPPCLKEHRIPQWDRIGEYNLRGAITGIERLANRLYNKGLAFTIQERQLLGIHGLLPAAVKTEKQQIEHCTLLLERLNCNLDKYMYLMDLADRNQRLFYQLIASNTCKFLPLIYKPTLREVCPKFGMIYQRPRGLFISIKDKGHVYDILSNWPEKVVRAVVITDGEHILDQGDMGAYGMCMAIGKTMLYTALGKINPKHCLPIMLDCGTMKNTLILDPLYIGIREQRQCDCCYNEFIQEFMDAVRRRFGRTCLIQFEGFGNESAYRFLQKYHKKFCMFNDDIETTAATVLSGILVALKISQQNLKSQRMLLYCAGEAGIGIARLFHYAVIRSGVNEKEAQSRIWLFDTKGLVIKDRPEGCLTNVQSEFAHFGKPIHNLAEAIETVTPSILIGAADVPDAFTIEILQLMAKINERPIIFALSSFAERAECTPKAAYMHTNGTCIFATGAPFKPFDFRRKTYHTSQADNALIYPGIVLGVLCAGMLTIPKDIFLIAAETLAEFVTNEEMCKGLIYPTHSKFLCSTIEIARWVMEYAYRFNLATVLPEPENKVEFIKSQTYDPHYAPVLPEVYLKDEVW